MEPVVQPESSTDAGATPASGARLVLPYMSPGKRVPMSPESVGRWILMGSAILLFCLGPLVALRDQRSGVWCMETGGAVFGLVLPFELMRRRTPAPFPRVYSREYVIRIILVLLLAKGGAYLGSSIGGAIGKAVI